MSDLELMRTVLPIPTNGNVGRVRRGGVELVLERARGSWLLVVHDGHAGQRYHLGLPHGSELWVCYGVPAHPIQLGFTDGVALAPGGRVRGSVLVPLPVEVRWVGPDGAEELLLTVPPRDLETVFFDGVYQHRCDVTLLQQGAVPWAEGLLQVPLTLRNDLEQATQVGLASLCLTEEDLSAQRGRLFARPRRFVFDESGVREEVRPFSAHDPSSSHNPSLESL